MIRLATMSQRRAFGVVASVHFGGEDAAAPAGETPALHRCAPRRFASP